MQSATIKKTVLFLLHSKEVEGRQATTRTTGYRKPHACGFVEPNAFLYRETGMKSSYSMMSICIQGITRLVMKGRGRRLRMPHDRATAGHHPLHRSVKLKMLKMQT